MGSKQLNCYCDHCANNTCTTKQLCYAEWKLVNYNELVSHLSRTTETLTNIINHASTINYPLIKLEKNFNCYNGKDDELFIKTICSETASNTSHTIRRCCKTEDYCNKLDGLLPTELEATEEFQRILPSGFAHHNQSSGLYEQYSSLPLPFQVVIIIVIASLILYTTALFNQLAEKRSRSSSGPPSPPNRDQARYDNSIKRAINDFLIRLGIRRDLARRNASLPVEASPNVSESRIGRGQDEEGSENHDTVGGYDTNSMASREPLIKHLNKVKPGDTINFLHNHPHMSDETTGGRQNSFLQVTIGSGMLEGDETSSGSGKGQAYLSQRSVSHDIQLNSIIGRGFFGVVWRGEYKGQPVAVKIFSASAEASWERETEIYQTSMLRHKNILGLIATDRRIDTQMSGFWLVTDYYPMGSLFDFLSKNTITMWDAIRMAFSIANGLAHLHIEIFGTRAKPAIAHRDMKSKNILVKNDGTCCIADLGMAVRYNSTTGIVDVPTNTRIGTRRYLAPEILDDKLNLLDFEAVKATDIYAFGLVLWEILRRTCLVSPECGNTKAFIEREIVDPGASRSGHCEDNIPTGPRPPPGWIERRNLEQPSAREERQQSRLQQLHLGLPTVNEQQQEEESQDVISQTQHKDLAQEEGVPAMKEEFLLQNDNQPQQAQALQTSHLHYQAQRQIMEKLEQNILDQQWQQQEQSPQNQNQLQDSQPGSRQIENQRETPNKSVETLDENHELAYAYDEFQVPYQEDVSQDPSAAEMYEVVCVKKIRPRLSPRWLKFASMQDYITLMTECWYEKPQARLSALRLRKSLSELASKYFNLNIMEYD